MSDLAKRSREEGSTVHGDDERVGSSNRHRKRSRTDSNSHRRSRDDREPGSSSSSSSRRRRSHKSSSASSSTHSGQSDAERAARIEELKAAKKAEKLAAKKALREAEAKVRASLGGYTNEDNPFGDAALDQRFVWGAKLSKEKKELGLDDDGWNALELKRTAERAAEIEKAKKRRIEREKAREERLAERERERREEDFAMHDEMAAAENAFHAHQSRVRVAIRLKEGRATPLDIISSNLRLLEPPQEAERRDQALPGAAALATAAKKAGAIGPLGAPVGPESYYLDAELAWPDLALVGCSTLQLEAMEAEIVSITKMADQDPTALDFWKAFLVILTDEKASRTRAEEESKSSATSAVPDVNGSVADDSAVAGSSSGGNDGNDGHSAAVDSSQPEPATSSSVVRDRVDSLLSGKSVAALDDYRAEIRNKLSVGGPDVEPEFWNLMLARSEIHRCRAQVREYHTRVLNRRLALLQTLITPEEEPEDESQALVVNDDLDAEAIQPAVGTSGTAQPVGTGEDLEDLEELEELEAKDEGEAEKAPAQDSAAAAVTTTTTATATATAASAGTSEPATAKRPHSNANDPDEEDLAAIVGIPGWTRKKAVAVDQESAAAQHASFVVPTGGAEWADDKEGLWSSMGAVFDVDLGAQAFKWGERFRPRRPQFFNRIKTGYDWNGYNRTHYGGDAPPPKMVMGYKFNIFYPDLIDKSKSPEYVVESIPGNSEEALLRFHAGPPYEDVAFKIVNRQWAVGRKKGFRCRFDRGVFSLWFNFERVRYRR